MKRAWVLRSMCKEISNKKQITRNLPKPWENKHFLLGKKKAATGSEHGLAKTFKTVGNMANRLLAKCGNGENEASGLSPGALMWA